MLEDFLSKNLQVLKQVHVNIHFLFLAILAALSRNNLSEAVSLDKSLKSP